MSQARTMVPAPLQSLCHEIADLRLALTNLKSSLAEARKENARLKNELAATSSRATSDLPVDLSSLRRRVTFTCHPDRGGDVALMQNLNALFDFLQDGQAARAPNS